MVNTWKPLTRQELHAIRLVVLGVKLDADSPDRLEAARLYDRMVDDHFAHIASEEQA